MTTDERFGRNLAAWLQEDGAHRVADHLDEVLVQTAATRQRSWWSSPERWLPMDTTFRPRLFTVPPTARLLAVAGLILLILAIAILAAGSRQRLPDPFGLARNGAFVTSRDGDIFLLDPATTTSRPVVVGEGFDFSPIFSRDGTKMLFLRSRAAPTSSVNILTMYVADADGSDPRAITPPTESLDWFDWSPDSARIAYMAKGNLYVVGIDGGEPVRLKGTGAVHFPTWLPTDGKDILFRSEGPSPAVYLIAADGSGERRLVSKTPANNEFDYQSIGVSPDGSTVTFTRWSSKGPDGRPYPDSLGWLPRVYALDVATGEEREFPSRPGTGQRGSAVFSPDGELVAYARIYREGAFQIVVANADASGNERPIGEKRPGKPDGSEVNAAWAFTPDGTGLLVRYGDDDQATTYLMPLDGSTPVDLGSGGFEFVDVQRLAP
jgi:Tol biopolymer transport system component